ncbi:Ltp family lipoprotein [Streptococcus mitis]|uniref:Ltp family lipoprotein n=1 Tax=Streptococcus mitis TaxID=28037 RepID=UPI001CBD9F9C|nr:Ltp family lipoprotein [Streptococcus mitis]MBZ2104999.1 Ltp family lipoprotein [Streptococcus mitis]MBZ2108535.1 Ltp family lipoprotein [Streptococcus mitis]
MNKKRLLVCALALSTVGVLSTIDTTGVLPLSAQTVQADTQTLTPTAKYYIILPNDAEIFNRWKGTVNIPIIGATKTTPELSYFQESDRYYIANENKSGANYIEWKGTVEEFKEAIKKLTDKKSTTATPKKDEKPTDEKPKPTPKPDEKPKPTPKPTVQSGWLGSSYYQDGKKVTSKWIFDKKYNSFFYLDASGNYVQNAWVGNYYLKSGGYMAKSEWIYDKNHGSYYYLTSEGSYARNTWVGNYYLKSNGKMAKGEWVYDKNYGSYYYLTSEGSYARNAWSGNYYLKSNGKMAKSEWVYDKNYGSYYYLTSEGSYARNTWVGNYYLKSNGKMAKSEWVDGGRYYVGANGLWETKASTNSEYSAALEKAKSYNSWANMSKKRLYKQLTSKYGEKFQSDAAQYAIDHLNADYKSNALAKAKNYRKWFKDSKSAIYNQLVSPYGEEFTEEEANYAINHLDD